MAGDSPAALAPAPPADSPPRAVLAFRGGTLELFGLTAAHGVPEGFVADRRVRGLRAEASRYSACVLWLREHGIAYEDRARRYAPLALPVPTLAAARPYQLEALQAWNDGGQRGVVVLPTGAGKTHLAISAIAQRQRPALVIAPTLELVRQWAERLHEALGEPIGVLGGGSHDVQPLTVTTYDSAHLHMGHLGDRFGLLVFDECHHLPTDAYSFAALGSIAPFRLGLTATPERSDSGPEPYLELIGPILFRKDIVELSGKFLADYDTEQLPIELTDAERTEHDEARATFREFVAKHNLSLGSPAGFQRFLQRASASHEGLRALAAYRSQRRLAQFSQGKLDALGALIERHHGERMLVFTDDNATAHRIACEFLLPVLTHRTKVRERMFLLQSFREGTLPVLVTSKVLNEGVDVPEASVAVVVSGSGSVREHVQRLGRVLRPQPGKRARLYELVTSQSSDERRSARRREHSAYR